MILLYLAEIAVAGWLYGLDSPAAYLVLLGIGLVSGLVLSIGETVMRWVCGFGGGIVLILAAAELGERGATGAAVAAVGLAGAALAVGSLAAAASGR